MIPKSTIFPVPKSMMPSISIAPALCSSSPWWMKKERVIGVLQLINALDRDGNIIPFPKESEEIIFGLASLVAVCLNNQRLSKAFYELLHSFVQVMVGAIDLRTPYNANHTKSMVFYGSRFVHWLNNQDYDWKFDEEMIDPFLMSIWLHDVGKLITPLEVMEKATRLGDKLPDIEHRITIAVLMEKIHALEFPEIAEEANKKIALLENARETIISLNTPGFLNDDMVKQLSALSYITCRNEKDEKIPLLTKAEFESLSIRRGTLTDGERKIIQSHVTYTADMLKNMKFEGEYASVPFWAASHHEFLDGSGYPDGKKADELPNEVRLLTILDVYDALTADDRPYKKSLSSEKAFDILYSMADEGKIDKFILDLFKESGAWK